MAIDVEDLLSEISADAPCGEDLSYDNAFLALEGMLRPQSAGGVVAGVEEEAVEPNWRQVRESSIELLRRSKDLRVAMYLALAGLKLEGVSGLRDGLGLLRGLLERYWERLFPQLDPDDDDDPLERINIVQSLSPATVSEQDPMKFRQRLAEVPLCNSAQMGRFSLRDIQIAKGEIPLPADKTAGAPDMAIIDAAFQDTATEELQVTSQAAAEGIEHLAGIATAFSENASQGQTPDLTNFQSVLGNIRQCVLAYLGKRGYGQPTAEEEGLGSSHEPETGRTSVTGDVRSPQEALLAIEKVCQYYDRHEPSSPIPLLLRRAQRLVSKNFLEVIEDVCPDALGQIQALGGTGGAEREDDYATE